MVTFPSYLKKCLMTKTKNADYATIADQRFFMVIFSMIAKAQCYVI
jgi:hypothetical protein